MARLLLLLIINICFIGSTYSANPEQLNNWSDWIKLKHPKLECYSHGKNSKLCQWPLSLNLNINNEYIDFSYTLQSQADKQFIQLPGNLETWPQQIKINGKASGVIERNNLPFVKLDKGTHRIEGKIVNHAKLNRLLIPANIAMINTFKHQQKVQLSNNNNYLLLNQKVTAQKPESDRLHIEVFRHYQDGIPSLLETRLKLRVTGKNREEILGKPLLENNELIGVNSPIPVKINAQGELVAQLKAGEYWINLNSRFTKNSKSLKKTANHKNWPNNEFLSVRYNNKIREIEISGTNSIDTQQTNIPHEWKTLPSYLLKDNNQLQIKVLRQGKENPAKNELSLTRKLWLDFNGKGITAKNHLQGKIHQNWRLDSTEDNQLQSAEVNQQAVMITLLDNKQGIEVRNNNVDINTTSRIENARNFSLSGWLSDVNSVRASLELPPGWRIFHATGIEQISGSWISQWSLWTIFIVLIVTAVAKQLFNLAVSALTLLSITLTFYEALSPVVFIPIFFALYGLLKISNEKISKIFQVITLLIAAIYILSLSQYTVNTFRTVIYPTVENPYYYNEHSHHIEMHKASKDEAYGGEQVILEEVVMTKSRLGTSAYRNEAPPKKIESIDNYKYAEQDRVQTGIGAPNWNWNSYQLNNYGEVTPEQKVRMYYMSPIITKLWQLAGLLSLFLLSIALFKHIKPLLTLNKQKLTSKKVNVNVMVLTLASVLLSVPSENVQAQDYPPQFLLEQLEKQLLLPPNCIPNCYGIEKANINIAKQKATIELDLYSAAKVAIPLLKTHNSFSLTAASSNGEALAILKKDQHYFVPLKEGQQKIQLSIELLAGESNFDFFKTIHQLSVNSNDWTVSGLQKNKGTKNINLQRKASEEKSKLSSFGNIAINPFVEVQRELVLGTEWQLHTRVIRKAPKSGSFYIKIPLLEGEDLLTQGITVNKKHAQLHFTNQSIISWNSLISPKEQLNLTANPNSQISEQWKVIPSSIWRINYEGLTEINESHFNQLSYTWKPQAEEKLTINIERLNGIEGQTYTIENLKLEHNIASTKNNSLLSIQVKSSIAQTFTFSLPETASINKLTLDNETLNTPLSNTVTVNLQAKSQIIDIDFTEENTSKLISYSPQITLPVIASNIYLNTQLAKDQWPLFIYGTKIGPAMLYWGMLCFIILAAIVLSLLFKKLNWQLPIGFVGWLLLGLGLSTINIYCGFIVALWFLLLGARQHLINAEKLANNLFNGMQVFIVFFSLITLVVIISTIPDGLLSSPDMKVVGNGSSAYNYQYYQDFAQASAFPETMVVHIPLWIYRGLILLWSLWLSTQLIKWTKWGWQAFSSTTLWKSKPIKADKAMPKQENSEIESE